MGLGKMFKAISRVFSAKVDSAADAIENDNAVEFGKQDIEMMEKEVNKATVNIAEIKSEVLTLEDQLKDIDAKVAKHESDATALDAAGNEALAVKNCEAADLLDSQAGSLREALTLQKELLEDQTEARDELKQAVMEAKSDLVSIKAMTDVAKTNAKLSEINTEGGTNALANFKARKAGAQKKMLKAKVLKDESGNTNSIEAQTAKALGQTGGSSRLERLRKK